MNGKIWADACRVCRWPVWTDMPDERGWFVVFDEGECHPWCAPQWTDQLASGLYA